MNKLIIIGGFAVLIILGGAFLVLRSDSTSKIIPPNVGDGGMMGQEEKGQDNPSTEFSGKVLAGSSSPFIEFNKSDYEKAKQAGKTVFLDFYADWCPICRAEEPEIFAGFNNLTTDNVVGFRVNFKDSSTDADEQALAREFNIPYQHTKVIIKNGAEISRFSNQWTKNDFDNALNSAL